MTRWIQLGWDILIFSANIGLAGMCLYLSYWSNKPYLALTDWTIASLFLCWYLYTRHHYIPRFKQAGIW